MRTRVITWLGVALSAGLVYWLLSQFDPAETWAAIAAAKVGWVLAGAVVYGLLFLLRGLRWSILLEPIKPVSARTATEVFSVGVLANHILPARLGDVARAFVLARREQIGAATSFSSVMLERILDGLTVVGLMSLVLWVHPTQAAWITASATLAAGIFLVAIGVCLLVVFNERRVMELSAKLCARLPGQLGYRIHGILARLSTGLHALKSPQQIAKVLALSLLIWLIETSVYVFVGLAFGLDVPLLGMVLVMSVLTLGLTAPSAPGFVGVFEYLIIQAIGLFGVAGEQAAAFALTVHAVHFVPGTLLGLASAWKSGLALREIRAAASHGADDLPEAPVEAEVSSPPA